MEPREAEVDDLGEPGPHLDGENLNLRPPIRDGLILEMPLAPLCSTDCQGLCAQCGARLDDDPGHARDFRPPMGGTVRSQTDLLDEQAETQGELSGRPEAQDLAQQHPVPSRPVEDLGSHSGDLQTVRHPEAAAHRLPGLRHLHAKRRVLDVRPVAAPVEAQVDLAELVERLGLASMPATLPLAMVHRSYSYENGRVPTNERLEFLGDSVLGLVVTDHLYATFPDLPEGQLAKMRSAIVNAHSLAEIAAGLEVGAFLQLGRGGNPLGAREGLDLADAMEAIIGAVYLELGLEGVPAGSSSTGSGH